MDLLSLSNPVFKTYLFYSSILVLKMLIMSPLTARFRLGKKVFANPEDAVGLKGKVKFDDPDVERVRRAHRNDLENILPFFIIGLIYTLTNPSVFIATNLFRAFTVLRILHTLVYAVVVMPQPSRALCWLAAYGITFYMGINSVIYFGKI